MGVPTGTKAGPTSRVATSTGQIYEAQQNDGTAHIEFPNVGNNATEITISAWFNGDTYAGGGDKNNLVSTIFSAHSAILYDG